MLVVDLDVSFRLFGIDHKEKFLPDEVSQLFTTVNFEIQTTCFDYNDWWLQPQGTYLALTHVNVMVYM